MIGAQIAICDLLLAQKRSGDPQAIALLEKANEQLTFLKERLEILNEWLLFPSQAFIATQKQLFILIAPPPIPAKITP